MRIRIRSGSLVLLVTLVVVLATVPGLAAADPQAGGSVVVPEGETVDGLEAFAGSVTIRGTVDGDLTAFAGDVTVASTGHVTGDIEGAAGSIRIAGTVDGDVSGAAGDVTVADGATIGGTLEAGAGVVRIDGTVNGDVTVGADRIVLGPAASVDGDLRYDGKLQGDRSAVAGTIVQDSSLGGANGFGPADPEFSWGLGIGLYGFLVNLALGALLLLLFPTFSTRIADRAVETPARTGAVGLLALVAIPIGLVLLALTIVGIPLTIAGAIIFGLLAWVGAVYGRIAVGTWLVSHTETDTPWAALVVGFLVVALAVRIPFLGGLAEFLVFLLGFGALVLVGTEGRRSRRTTPEATPEVDADVTSA